MQKMEQASGLPQARPYSAAATARPRTSSGPEETALAPKFITDVPPTAAMMFKKRFVSLS